jgi:hypothetical protein
MNMLTHSLSVLSGAGIAFERHREENEWLFGVARSHFKQALNANHLVYAQYRTKFIPVKGLRNAMLFVTLCAIVLALLGYFLHPSKCPANQTSKPLEPSPLGRYSSCHWKPLGWNR